MPYNKLLASAIATLITFSAPAMADTPPVPTLDNLHNQGATIPDTDPAQTYPESAYTLTEIENADPENLPQNAITLYDKNDDGTVTPKYYLVNLKDSVTNIGTGDTTKYFEWTKNETTGNLEFKEVSSLTEGKQTITVNYDTSNLQTRLRNSTDQSDTTITGTFVNQSTGSTYGNQYGGAIYNNGSSAKLGDINADFIGNYSSQNYSYAYGGAIYSYNGSTIGNITGDFIGNYAISENDYAYGGAIYNSSGIIGNINGDFIGNYASSTDDYVCGGAIYNYSNNSNSKVTIGDITGDFIGNYAIGYRAYGGAIYNSSGTIGNITGDFIGNYASSTESYANGGAIYNSSRTIGNITGDFIGNYASSTYDNATGGAIDNSGSTNAQIGDITGDFIGNYASSTGDLAAGGAIYNFYGTIGEITGDFIGNYASSTGYGDSATGGAIYNSIGKIEDITGDFIGNYVSASDGYADGGAIYNSSRTIGNITGDFIGNYASGIYANGGAIYNSSGTIGNITGDFIGNYALSENYDVNGGAIYNTASMTNITGDFVNNYASGVSSKGGAIYNHGTIEEIKGNFVGNYSTGDGGAIYNAVIYNSQYVGGVQQGVIFKITNTSFLNNYAKSTDENTVSKGGAIYSGSSLNIVAQDGGQSIFSGNYTESNGVRTPNAIYIETTQDTENPENRTETLSSINDTTVVIESKPVYRAPILTLNANTNGTIRFDDTIEGNLETVNIATTSYDLSVQSWVQRSYSVSTVAELVEYIKANPTSFSSWYTEGMTDTEILTYLYNSDGYLDTSNEQTISETERPIGYTLALTGDGTGTISLYNDVKNANVTSENVTVDFANNETRDYNFVSMDAGENTKLNIDLDLADTANPKADTITTQNHSTGTLILNSINAMNPQDATNIVVQIIKNTDPTSDLQLAIGDNIQNVAEDFKLESDIVNNTDLFVEYGGLALTTTDTINDSITIDATKVFDTLQLINQKESTGERIFQFVDGSTYFAKEDLTPATSGTLSINGLNNTTSSTINANNHTMFNLQNETTLNISNVSIEGAKDYAIKAENANAVVNLTNASFKNTDGTAIQSNVDINITADGGKSEFTGNTSAIQMNNATKSVNMTAINQGEIVLSDVVDGAQGYNVKLDGDDKSKITVNNNVNNANISLDNTNLYLSKETYFDNSQSLSLNSGAMYLNNNAVGTMHVPTLNLNGTTNLSVDVDLQNEVMDRVTADTYNVADNALLNVTDLNLLTTTDKTSVKILFADEPIANNVEYTGDSPVSYKGTNTVYSPIYRYDVQYGVDSEDKLGYFFFNRAASGSGSNGNISDSFNPAVLASPVAQQAGAYTTQLQAFNYAFQHADTFMNIPYLERVAMINAGKYALSPTGDATDVGTFSPLLTKEEDAGFWVKPYASFENVPLKNGPKVSNINYGTLIGYDSPLTSVAHGFERVLTGYIGYNGASQRYQGVDAYQNGGLIGGTATFYKGNFFNATTLSVGATAGDASTMYGSENYTMLLAGIGNKTGYNFEFWDGKVILQPNFLISYTFVNTFDYNNAAGVRIESDPLHAIQLSPGLKLIGNTKNGWQPYIGVNMVWNLLDDSRVTANDVRLPEMSIRPYVQYGVGVQKRFKDKFLAFGQAMIHNGGRNGVSLTAGLRWKVGRE